MTRRTKLILGITGAVAVGVVVGLMLAPEKGSDMRLRVKNKAVDWKDSLSDLFSNAKGELANLKGKASRARNVNS